MDQNLRVRYLALDEVDLRLDDGKIAMRPALEHETAAGGAQILQLSGIDPDIVRQHRGKRCHDLFRRPAPALLIDDVGLQEHSAAHSKARHRFRFEGAAGILLESDAVAFGNPLEECAVAG